MVIALQKAIFCIPYQLLLHCQAFWLTLFRHRLTNIRYVGGLLPHPLTYYSKFVLLSNSTGHPSLYFSWPFLFPFYLKFLSVFSLLTHSAHYFSECFCRATFLLSSHLTASPRRMSSNHYHTKGWILYNMSALFSLTKISCFFLEC